MIQEKDFLYRVPVKTSPITTPGGQIRNPEILVDIEGGEFMHGNILDANSTNKLINQSVDDKITEGGYVTKNLLDAETARATAKENEIKAQVDIINGDSTTEGSFRKAIADVVAAAPEDLDTLKEIADKLAGNDDLHTALNQAITEKADASALLNEVARATGVENNLKATLVNYALNSDVEEKLAQKADTTMLGEFIDKTSTEEQAINSPLHAKEYISVFHNTADGASGIKITNSGILAIDSLNENASPNKVFATDGSIADLTQYADATQLSNYVLTTALNQQVDTLNTAISAKQDAGNYIPYNETDVNDYKVNKRLVVTSDTSQVCYGSEDILSSAKESGVVRGFVLNPDKIEGRKDGKRYTISSENGIDILKSGLEIIANYNGFYTVSSSGGSFYCPVTLTKDGLAFGKEGERVSIDIDGIKFYGRSSNEIPSANGGFIDISNYVLKSGLPVVPTKTSQLTNDSNFIAADHISDIYLGFAKDLKIYSENTGNITTISRTGINFETDINDVAINEDGFFVSRDSDGAQLCSFTPSGIKFAGKTDNDIPTANGDFVNIHNFATQEDFSNLTVGLSRKQNKITVNEVDITDIETADITKLRTIVTNLINALSASDLIRETQTLE